MLWLAESKRGSNNAKDADAFSICCGRGKVKLPVAKNSPPTLLTSLLKGEHPKSDSFMENIRRYNSMFAFTWMAGKQDTTVNTGRGPFCFRIQGENNHVLGDLLPKPGEPPKFGQLYIYDPANEVQNRINVVRYFTFVIHLNKPIFYTISIYNLILILLFPLVPEITHLPPHQKT